jgi:integrase
MDTLCQSAQAHLRDGQQLADYIKLMATCGSRRNETLRLRWQDVDWDLGQITIGADGQTKNHEARVVDFNPQLETHLRDMHNRRKQDTDWLFPSRGKDKKRGPARTMVEAMRKAREKAGLNGFGFHDCRHHFISYCVMSGVDYMTIARWVGHKDGGVLIGRVYGHLSNEHARQQARKVVFAPVASVG